MAPPLRTLHGRPDPCHCQMYPSPKSTCCLHQLATTPSPTRSHHPISVPRPSMWCYPSAPRRHVLKQNRTSNRRPNRSCYTTNPRIQSTRLQHCHCHNSTAWNASPQTRPSSSCTLLDWPPTWRNAVTQRKRSSRPWQKRTRNPELPCSLAHHSRTNYPPPTSPTASNSLRNSMLTATGTRRAYYSNAHTLQPWPSIRHGISISSSFFSSFALTSKQSVYNRKNINNGYVWVCCCVTLNLSTSFSLSSKSCKTFLQLIL